MNRDLYMILKSLNTNYPEFKKQATNDENLVLVNRIKAGDLSARTEIICRNKNYISSQVERLYHGSEIEDVFMLSCEYIIPAAIAYNKSAGTSFTTYLHYYVKKAIEDQSGTYYNGFKTPAHAKTLRTKITKDELSENRTFSAEEIVSRYNVRIDVARGLVSLKKGILSMHIPVTMDNDGHTCDLASVIKDPNVDFENEYMRKTIVDELGKIMKVELKEREYAILMLRIGVEFGDSSELWNTEIRTLADLAKTYNLSIEGIRKIEKKALDKVRTNPSIMSLCEALRELN